MTDPDLHSLVARMADELDHGRQCLMDDRRLTHPLADEARALLADHVPDATEMVQPPAAGEVAELVVLLQVGSDCGGGATLTPEQCRRAAELLERLASPACVELKPSPELIEAFQESLKKPGVFVPLQPGETLGSPQPIRVSERLPEAGDCDAEGRCWWFDPHADGAWYMDTFMSTYTHWFPAHALPLPLPSGEGEA